MDQEMSFTYTMPLNVNVVTIKGEEHLFVEGDISTTDIDLVNDVMTKECQESMQKQILESNMKLDLEHEAFRGDTHEEKEINKTKIPAGKITDAVVKDLGNDRYATRVKAEINRNNPNYKMIKGNLLEKYLDAFSVAFLPVDVKNVERDGQQIQLLNDVRLLNVALTGNPCNTKAQLNEVFMKSMSALEEYKKMKEIDPSIERALRVKSVGKKENPLSFVFNKLMSGQSLDKKELKLLSAAIEIAGNKGKEAELIKDYYTRISNGQKLSWKEYYIFRELIEVEQEDQMVEMAKSHSSPKGAGTANIVGKNTTKLNENSKKMTDEPNTEGAEGQEPTGQEPTGQDVSGDVEQKALLKSISESLKSINEKYDAVVKDNESLKETVNKNAEALAEVMKALNAPVHKSQGAALNAEELKAKAGAQAKSVDPLELCF